MTFYGTYQMITSSATAEIDDGPMAKAHYPEVQSGVLDIFSNLSLHFVFLLFIYSPFCHGLQMKG